MTGNHFYQDICGSGIESSFPSNTYHHDVQTDGEISLHPSERLRDGACTHHGVQLGSGTATVSVDVSSILTVGASYEVRNAQNFFGPPVLSGVYAGGLLTLPMTGLTVAAPIGGTLPHRQDPFMSSSF